MYVTLYWLQEQNTKVHLIFPGYQHDFELRPQFYGEKNNALNGRSFPRPFLEHSVTKGIHICMFFQWKTLGYHLRDISFHRLFKVCHTNKGSPVEMGTNQKMNQEDC